MKPGAIALARPRLLRRSLYCVHCIRSEGISMPRNFYFGKDADIVAGSANFASLIATGFASYGLSSARQTAVAALNTALQSAYSAAINPSTRTPVTIEAKTLAIQSMRANAV